MTIVYFIRHGQSISNAGQVTEHPGASPLTEKGHQQAQYICNLFDQPPDLIVTSPYIRTRETAQPTIEQFPNVPVEEWTVQEFTYLNPVLWQGTTGEERYPAALAYWERNDPFFRDANGAESFADLMERIRQIELMIQFQAAQRIAIFTHGHFSRGFLWKMINPWLEINANWMQRHNLFIRGLSMPNGAVIEFRFENGKVWNSGVRIDHIPAELRSY